MLFIVGGILVILTILYFFLAMLASRNPEKKGWYANESMRGGINTLHTFMILSLFISGIGLMWKAAMTFHSRIELSEYMAVFLIVLLVSIAFNKKVLFNRRMAAYTAKTAG